MNEKKHNVLHIHWFRDMIFAGFVFCICDFFVRHQTISVKTFLNGAGFIFVIDCIINTIINGIFDIAEEDNKNGGI